MKDGFILHSSAKEIIENLNPEQVKTLMLAMLAHNDGEELPEMDAVVKMAFIPMRQQMDRENEKYQETCRKRAEAGASGGAVKQSNAAKSKQSQAKKAIATKSKQTVANQADKDTETDTEKDKDIDSAAAEKKEKESCTAVIDLYNSLCPHYPSVRTLSDDRCKKIMSSLQTHTLDELQLLFTKADQSSFLRGKEWVSFDWLIQDANMAKVLDGNYDDQPDKQRAAPKKQTAAKSRFNNFDQRSYDYQSLEGQLLSAQTDRSGG